MSNVTVPSEGPDTAVLLLGAASELDLPARVVKFSPDGHYTVPKEVAEKARLAYETVEEEEEPDQPNSQADIDSRIEKRLAEKAAAEAAEAEDEPAPAKKATAKKTTAKKAASKE